MKCKKWVYSIRSYWDGRTRNYVECDDYLTGARWSPDQEYRWMAADALDKAEQKVSMLIRTEDGPAELPFDEEE